MLGSDGDVRLVVSLELELEVGLVEAVVFKLPLVFSFVVLGLEVELVVPYVEDGVVLELLAVAEDGYVESVVDAAALLEDGL